MRELAIARMQSTRLRRNECCAHERRRSVVRQSPVSLWVGGFSMSNQIHPRFQARSRARMGLSVSFGALVTPVVASVLRGGIARWSGADELLLGRGIYPGGEGWVRGVLARRRRSVHRGCGCCSPRLPALEVGFPRQRDCELFACRVARFLRRTARHACTPTGLPAVDLRDGARVLALGAGDVFSTFAIEFLGRA